MSSRYTPCKFIPYPTGKFIPYPTDFLGCRCSKCFGNTRRYTCSGCQKECCADCFKDFWIYFEGENNDGKIFFRFCSKKCIIDNSSHEELSEIVEIFKKNQDDQKYKIEIKSYPEDVSVYEYQFVRLTKSTKFYCKQ